MNKIKFTMFIITLSLSVASIAQRMGEHHYGKSEIINAEKIKFFNEKLSLTNEESEKFWPIYNDFQSRREQLFNDRKNNVDFLSNNADNMDEIEINEYAKKVLDSFNKESGLMSEYFEKFKEVLPLKKAVKIFNTEHEFKIYLMHYLRDDKSIEGKGKGQKNH